MFEIINLYLKLLLKIHLLEGKQINICLFNIKHTLTSENID